MEHPSPETNAKVRNILPVFLHSNSALTDDLKVNIFMVIFVWEHEEYEITLTMVQKLTVSLPLFFPYKLSIGGAFLEHIAQ